jgi:hypothetical protein
VHLLDTFTGVDVDSIKAVLTSRKHSSVSDAVARAEWLGCRVNDAQLEGEVPVLLVEIPTQEAANAVALSVHLCNEWEFRKTA